MTEQKQRRKPRKYTDEFKQQLVELYRSSKRRCDICREYDIATSLFDKWVKQASNSGSFHEKDNRTPEQEELIRLRKENQPYHNVVVSDLTYVRVGNHWNYICILIDLFNREIVGYSAGEHKTAQLVKQAFRKVEGNLSEIHIFHTDRGNEFKNETIEELLETFHIERSLNHKGCPYDNAVAEATFKVIKTEFVWNETFHTLEELKIKLWDYVNWYNHHRIHSSLGYQTPVQYRENNLKKFV